MSYFLGVDIGSVNAYLSLVDGDGRAVHLGIEKITSNARESVNSLITSLRENFDLGQIAAAGVTGSAKGVIPEELNWAEHSNSLATASGLLHSHPDARTIIQIGGQSSLIIGLEDGLKKPWNTASNSLCAAGTGRFLEQQAYRLGISMDEFAGLALQCRGSPPRIAARCSVFAKSDLIHLQQKGVPVEAMLYALCESIARMVVSLRKGTFEEPIYFVGGVAANRAIAKALNNALSARNGHQVQVIVPENYLHLAATGSALLSRGNSSRVSVLPEIDEHQHYFELPGLPNVTVQSSAANRRIEGPCSGYLGVDVGSTSTKAVILDESGEKILAKNYLMTAGRPIDAVKQVFRNLLRDGANGVRIAGTGVTGSGRYLVGSLIGADIVKNEITAQTRAAAEIDPEADIIEIGGQDSKLVIKRNQVVTDYQMNKACAAGTGSFIDEMAEMLGVSVKNGDFANLAFNAPHTIDLGTRCAAFMNQAVASAQQEEVALEVITASLANSIAKNYLSKVVGSRKLGSKIILTGAVFYNQAVVSAFSEQLKGKTLTVAEHREVSGAMGAALLAREIMLGQKSKFKGFQEVIGSTCDLSTFTCKVCDNNCAITRMLMPNEKPTFYGSRCDLFDSNISQERKETFFDEREKLLLQEYRENTGTGPSVGIPRSLLVYDYAPLLIGFLNALDARVVLSSKTTQEIMEQAVELSYTDSCFPLKLLHGHVAALHNKVDYVLYPCAIRLGEKDGDENQKYSCPLIQASPFIVSQALNLGERLLIPTIDFSQGDADTIKSLASVAVKMGFSSRRSKKAALAGIEAQRRFETERTVFGNKLLKQLHESDQLGVVLISRSYMSQDSGANLGIAEKLAQLGVVPIPLDYLPLDSIDPKEYSDRPYWSYESKFIAGTAIVTSDPHLYGLILTNFGCGPNSLILRIVEDITGNKPLGQLEIDEHAAEAGIVTRLEAFVDTIKGYANSAQQEAQRPYIYRGTTVLADPKKTVLLPRMAPFVDAVAAAMEAYGITAVVLPEPDERNILYSNQVTSGTECLPYRITLGDFMRVHYENGHNLKDAEALMAGSYGPCRFGKYVTEQMRVLRDIGFDLPIRSTVSNSAYSDLGLGNGFERLAWRGVVAIDYLQKLLWRTRPYEKENGMADSLFDEYVRRVADHISRKEDFADTLKRATSEFMSLMVPNLPRRPLVGINGEIYLRSNKFSNCNLVKECEEEQLGQEY
jgi:predicted CoA-substrate-specific enzyme activase